MSTDPTTSSNPLPIPKGKRSKRLDALCDKYIKELLKLTSVDTLRKYFDEQDIKDAELEYASEQMTEYAQSQLMESFTTLFDEEHIKERLDYIEAFSEHKKVDYESVFANSINQQSGEHGDQFHRVIPRQTQVAKAELYRLKRKELERIQAQRDSLRLENKAKMDALKKKQADSNLLKKPLPNVDLSKFGDFS